MKRTHGESRGSNFYRRFIHIRNRCTFKWDKDYIRYGKRGITFDWKKYEDFKKDMYDSFLIHCKKFGISNTTLERINNNKGYSKKNCRWATFYEQAKNRRTNRFIFFRGKKLIVADWARKLGVSRQTIGYRLRNGWNQISIIKTPFLHTNRYHKFEKRVLCIKGVSRKKFNE